MGGGSGIAAQFEMSGSVFMTQVDGAGSGYSLCVDICGSNS
jgi:hypothetical protein